MDKYQITVNMINGVVYRSDVFESKVEARQCYSATVDRANECKFIYTFKTDNEKVVAKSVRTSDISTINWVKVNSYDVGEVK